MMEHVIHEKILLESQLINEFNKRIKEIENSYHGIAGKIEPLTIKFTKRFKDDVEKLKQEMLGRCL